MQPLIIVQAMIKAVLLVGGAVANVYSISRISLRRKPASSYSSLKLNLCIADMILIATYSGSGIAWIFKPNFIGLPGVCKGLQFILSLSFNLCSFVTIGIAVERVVVVLWPLRHHLTPTRKHQRHYRSVLVVLTAWSLAIVTSVPQLAIWDLTEPTGLKDDEPSCTSIWRSSALDTCVTMIGNVSLSNASFVQLNISKREYILQKWSRCLLENGSWPEKRYQIIRLGITFWCPVLVIFTCNFLLYTKLSDCSSPRRPLSSRDRTVVNLRRAARRATVRHILTLTVFYLCCWLPYNFVALTLAIDFESTATKSIPLSFLTDVVIFWAVINPFVYKKPQNIR